MPLLQGQPFKLINSPDIYPAKAEIYTIQHTGEKFISKSDYEDRLALYSQSIWTCQCTGHSGLTHKEAWMSEAKVRIAARNAIPLSLQKPLLVLVHHSLSPLEQLIEAASILCHSQYHVGEELLLLYPQKKQVRIMKSKEIPKINTESNNAVSHIFNGICSEDDVSILNGSSNGLAKEENPGTSPGKENQAKEMQQTVKDDLSVRRDMLPKLYDVYTLDDQKLIENVPAKYLSRPYRIPSKDQLRLFIRSCALRQRGSTCTPWVVTEDLIRKFNIPNKLPSLFLPSKPHQGSAKRKAQSSFSDDVKRPKTETKIAFFKENITKVPPLVISNLGKKSAAMGSNKQAKSSLTNFAQRPPHPSPVKLSWSPTTKHPLSLGKPKIMPSSPSFSLPPTTSKLPCSKLPTSKLPTSKGVQPPRKRGRPPLSQEEKDRNKKLRQASLLAFINKVDTKDIIKIKTSGSYLESKQTSSYLQTPSPAIGMPYKSPIKRANTPEAIMKLPLIQRFVHEHKTIKGVRGQFRRYAYTRDLILAKLSPAQIQMLPDEALKHDLLARQKKVQDKKFFENMTPEEKKQFIKNKARTVALERWKERKLKNLKVEDKTVSGLLSLPEPTLVATPMDISNSLFGDIVMVTDFIKCFQELLFGDENVLVTSSHIMEAITAGSRGYKVIADIICSLLPTIIHDDISKNCKELGVRISIIPITYQTAHELARLCLRKQDNYDTAAVVTDEIDFIGREKNELSDELIEKLECLELWELNCSEMVAVLKALVHKALCTASLSVYVGEVEDKVLKCLRERRKFLRQIQKDQKAELQKRKEQRIQSKKATDIAPKRQRGRPRISPKPGTDNLKHFLNMKNELGRVGTGIGDTVLKRKLSAEKLKKEKDELMKTENERIKQLGVSEKRRAVDRKYEEIVTKRDNLVRKTPIGFDRDHNRYWIFHSATPGLYVEKGWVDDSTAYTYSLQKPQKPSTATVTPVETPLVTGVSDSSDEDKPLAMLVAKTEAEDNKTLSSIREEAEEEKKPLAILKTEIEEDNRPLSQVKSKLTISPMKMAYRGRPPKEAYVLVDEDTQTFPPIGENKWFCYQSMEEVKALLSCLTDEGLRESQLIAAININLERLQKHFNKKHESLTLNSDSADRLKQSLKDDIIQIERELIEGWLGSVANFDEWERKAKEAEDVSTLGTLLIEAQSHMQMKYLKSIMAPVKECPNQDSEAGTQTEFEEVEGPGVESWRAAVKACRTYSRLHVLVGVFDSCIKWEKSMATRKCKICRSKLKADPLVMCAKCEASYHMYCLRPPLKEDPGESWTCPACMPKKTRREERQMTQPDCMIMEDQDEKEDPTFSLEKRRATRPYNKKKKPVEIKQERECSVCAGRIGLISCSKCSTAFHSECHDPPLLSRARRDWVCGHCLDPKMASQKKDVIEEIMKRTKVEEIEIGKRKTGNSGPRDKMGRFLKGPFIQSSNLVNEIDQVDVVEGDEKTLEEYGEVELSDKLGRSARGAKVKALENMTVEGKSRRSGRNQSLRKNYKDESEQEESDDEEENEDEEVEEKEDEDGDSSDGNEDEKESGSENEGDDGPETSKKASEDESDGDSGSDEETVKEQDKKEESSESGSESGSESDSGSESESDDDSDSSEGQLVQRRETKISNLSDMSSEDSSSEDI